MKTIQKMMIKQTNTIALDTTEMVLMHEEIARTAIPGQFLHISVQGHTLRRPVSIADVNKKEHTITILFKQVGTGTQSLAKLPVGATLDVLGPNGNGFNIPDETNDTILLIGGGIGVPPLYYLGKSLVEKGCSIISVLGFQTKDYVFYEQKFSELGKSIIVTDDGSYGEKGLVTDVLQDVASIDCYYSCGPLPMLKAVRSHLSHKKGYLSLEERMGCGVGACFACIVPTNDEIGYKKICQDGPVFQAEEVQL